MLVLLGVQQTTEVVPLVQSQRADGLCIQKTTQEGLVIHTKPENPCAHSFYAQILLLSLVVH